MLKNVTSNQVKFDPTNREHQVAFTSLTVFGRQHPTLRFRLESPYVDIRNMMFAKVGEEFARQQGVLDEAKNLYPATSAA